MSPDVPLNRRYLTHRALRWTHGRRQSRRPMRWARNIRELQPDRCPESAAAMPACRNCGCPVSSYLRSMAYFVNRPSQPAAIKRCFWFGHRNEWSNAVSNPHRMSTRVRYLATRSVNTTPVSRYLSYSLLIPELRVVIDLHQSQLSTDPDAKACEVSWAEV